MRRQHARGSTNDLESCEGGTAYQRTRSAGLSDDWASVAIGAVFFVVCLGCVGLLALDAPSFGADAAPTPHAPGRQMRSDAPPRKAFAFLQTSQSYTCLTKVAIRSLQLTGAKEPIVLMTTLDDVSAPAPGVQVVRVPNPPTRGRGRYRDTFTKLHIARLPFDRVMFFDSDILFHRSPSFLFEVNPRGGIAGPEAYWMSAAPVASGGPLIVDPSPTLFADVLDAGDLDLHYEGEMDYIIEKFNASVRLPYHVSILVAEFVPDHELYMLRGGTPRTFLLVHFDNEWKPYLWPNSRVSDLYPDAPFLQEVYAAWNALRETVC